MLKQFFQRNPNNNKIPLTYIFETYKLKHKPNTLWLHFGENTIDVIQYVSAFTNDKVYGFAEPDEPSQNKDFPLNDNVECTWGNINEETIFSFIEKQNKKVSFVHIDTPHHLLKIILNALKKHFDNDCIVIVNEMLNPAESIKSTIFEEFVKENNVKWQWLGCLNIPFDVWYQNLPFIIHSLGDGKI